MLKNIEEVLKEIDGSESAMYESENVLVFLKNRKAELKEKGKCIRENIEAVMRDFPLNQEKFLSDMRRVENRQKKLTTQIEAENGKLEKLQDKLRYYKLKCN